MNIDWRLTLTNVGTPLVEVMKIIEKVSLRIACVVDEEMNLLGIVTDGDIRRALIAGKGLNTPINEIMVVNPLTVAPGYSRAEVLALLQQKRLIHMPVTTAGKLLGLITLENLVQPQRLDNPVFIMAGGFGTRLSPLTDDCPKPLLKVGSKPLLERIIDQFIQNGFYNFYISTHYLPEMIREYFGDGSAKNVSIQYIHEENPLGTGGALGLLPKDQIKKPVIMINGDILTTINFSQLLSFHAQSEASATMAVREYSIQVPYGVVEVENNHISKITEKPKHTFFVNAGIYVIEPELIYSLQPNQRIDMPTLLEQNIAINNNVGIYPIHEYWLDIGRISDFEKAQQDVVLMDKAD